MPKNGDSREQVRECVQFYDGRLIGFHASFSDGLTELQMKNCLDKPENAHF
jgi:hypothetical protein